MKTFILFIFLASNVYGQEILIYEFNLENSNFKIIYNLDNGLTLAGTQAQINNGMEQFWLFNGPIYDKGFQPLGLLVS